MGLIPTFTGLTTGTEMIILAIAIIYALGTIALQRKVMNAKKMRQIQAKIQKESKELNEMVKRKAPDAEIAAKQKAMMPLLSESMKSSIKPMFVILPLFLIVYYVIVPALPLAPGNTKSVQGFFFICAFVIGLIAAIILMISDRKTAKKELAEMEAIGASPEGKSDK